MRLRAHEVTSIGKEIVYVRRNVGKDVLSIRRSFYYLSCPSFFPFFPFGSYLFGATQTNYE